MVWYLMFWSTSISSAILHFCLNSLQAFDSERIFVVRQGVNDFLAEVRHSAILCFGPGIYRAVSGKHVLAVCVREVLTDLRSRFQLCTLVHFASGMRNFDFNCALLCKFLRFFSRLKNLGVRCAPLFNFASNMKLLVDCALLFLSCGSLPLDMKSACCHPLSFSLY